jgi:hypothetical protein
MKKLLFPLISLLTLTFFVSSTNAAGSCVKKELCKKAVPQNCLKIATARYHACRSIVTATRGRCIATTCFKECNKISDSKFRAVCHSICKRRHSVSSTPCSRAASAGYARCEKSYATAKNHCSRTKHRTCRTAKTTPRTTCLKVYGGRHTACLKGATSEYTSCRAKYMACMTRCSTLRGSSTVKKACYRACGKKHAKDLSACHARLRTTRLNCVRAYNAGQSSCKKLPLTGCNKRWSCGPCR